MTNNNLATSVRLTAETPRAWKWRQMERCAIDSELPVLHRRRTYNLLLTFYSTMSLQVTSPSSCIIMLRKSCSCSVLMMCLHLIELDISSEDCTDSFHQAGSKLQQIPYQCRDRHHQRCCEALFYDMYARGITVAVIRCEYSRCNIGSSVCWLQLAGQILPPTWD